MGLYNKIIDLQKLRTAWQHVYKNRPKEGVDQVSCEEFETDRENQLKLLHAQLKDHIYECQPVRLCPLYKGEKVRYISLYCMRDKVVQTSAAFELSRLYEGSFAKSCRAYRNGQSALQAGQDISAYVKTAGEDYVLRTDIQAFFDCIRQERLFVELQKVIREEDVLELLRGLMRAPCMEKSGELVEKRVGLYQGSSLSPILSNIYLMQLDLAIERESRFYVRYSDDILIFFDSAEAAQSYCGKLSLYLEKLGLRLNQEKTKIARVKDGFEFLGYQFDDKGFATPDKARGRLSRKLEEIWMNPAYTSFDQRIRKAMETVNGWEQYFVKSEKPDGILEYVVWVYRAQKTGNLDIAKMSRLRSGLENPYKDAAVYLADIWKRNDRKEECLREYEIYYCLPELWMEDITEAQQPMVGELLDVYARYIVREDPEIRTELIQLYSDLKKYHNAALLTGQDNQDKKSRSTRPVIHAGDADDDAAPVTLNPDEQNRFMELFAGREDLYALNECNERNQRICEEILQPLLPEVVQMHLAGEKTVSTYIQRSNATVKYLVIDLDISKGVLLGQPENILEEYMKKCLETAEGFLSELRRMGLNAYLEHSGFRGYHIWVFFDGWIPVRYVNLLTDVLDARISSHINETDRGIRVEYFPNKTRVREGKKGQCIKLPWGVHPKSGKRSCFLSEDGSILKPQKSILDQIVCSSLNQIKRILSAEQAAGADARLEKRTEVDRDLTEFGAINDAVATVLNGCNLMRYLCQKARKTQYLTHFERLSILYVFGHMGEDGQEFIHKVMSFTLNYSEHVTQKFIQRCPEKPISCVKLRDQYKQISAEIGCTCSFRHTKNCYPSPVMHALKQSEENDFVTMPLSKTVSADRQTLLKNEINVASRVQELAERMIELRKQQRGLEKGLAKYERELSVLFDENKTDSMEIKMGLLVRKQINGKTEWSIEL